MKHNSSFVVHTLSWILYAVMTAATAAVILFKCIHLAPSVPVLDTVVLSVFGLVLGLGTVLILNRKKITPWDYLSMRNGMAFCWALCLIALLTVAKDDWLYTICVPIAAACVPFMGLYLPRYTKLWEEQEARLKKQKDS